MRTLTVQAAPNTSLGGRLAECGDHRAGADEVGFRCHADGRDAFTWVRLGEVTTAECDDLRAGANGGPLRYHADSDDALIRVRPREGTTANWRTDGHSRLARLGKRTLAECGRC